MKYYNFDKSLVLNSKGEWDHGKMREFLADFTAQVVARLGGPMPYPLTRGKAEEFARENGLNEKETGPILIQLAKLLSAESARLWQNHMDNVYDADEYVRMASDRDYPGQFIIELQTYHLYVSDGEIVYDPHSKYPRIYAKYLCTGLDIHFSDRRTNKKH